jgi:hypothetical protein
VSFPADGGGENPNGLDHTNLPAHLGLVSALEDMESAARTVEDAKEDAQALEDWDASSRLQRLPSRPQLGGRRAARR